MNHADRETFHALIAQQAVNEAAIQALLRVIPTQAAAQVEADLRNNLVRWADSLELTADADEAVAESVARLLSALERGR